MRVGLVLFGMTAGVLFSQMLYGGILFAGLILPWPHIINGFIVLGFAAVSMAVALVERPSYLPVRILGVMLVVMVFSQGLLGFMALGARPIIVLYHFVNAMLIYSTGMIAVFFAIRWNSMPLEGKRGPVAYAMIISGTIWLIFFLVDHYTTLLRNL